MFSLMGIPRQTALPIQECERCGKSFVPQNYRQATCRAHRCVLEYLEREHAPSKYATGGGRYGNNGSTNQ